MKGSLGPSRSKTFAAAIGGLLCVALAGDNATVTVKKICRRVYVDGPTDDDLEREGAEIAALGGSGRRVLVSLASSIGTQGDRAMGFLLRLEDANALLVARKLLSDRSSRPELKRRALSAVGYLHDTASAARVVKIFRLDENEDVVREAARTLSALGDEEGLGVLREALMDPRYAHVRGDLVEAVGVPGHDRAVPVLVSMLNGPVYRDSERARASLMASLGRIGTKCSLAEAVAIARTLNPETAGLQERLQELEDALHRRRTSSKDPIERADLDTVILELHSLAWTPR